VTQASLVNRRTFVKGMLAAGATVTVAACAPVAAPSGPAPAAPVAPPTVTGPSWIHPKSLVRAAPGYGGAHLTWKYGDTVKWLPPEKYQADAAADALAKLPKEKLTDIYSKMLRSRTYDNTMRDLYVGGKEGLLPGYYGTSGQEAASVGFTAALNPDDYVATTHRPNLDFIAKGGSIREMAAEVYLKATGVSSGRSDPMHTVDNKLGFTSSGIVGAGFYMAAGAAWSAKVRKSGQVAVFFAGDASCNSRSAFTTIRSAANYKLPLLIAIQNNFQGVSNPAAVTTPTPYVADYFTGLGLPTVVVDGNNIAQVYAAAKEAVDRARAGEGPSVTELMTWRWYDHSGWGGAKAGVDAAWGLPYRTDDEVRAWMARDPIGRMGTFLVERGLFTQGELDALKAKAKAEMDEAVVFARLSPEPRPEDGVKFAYTAWVPPATQFFEHPVVT